MIGGATFPEALEWSDEEIQACFDEEIAPILAIRGDPVWRRIFRFPAGIAQYNLGHLALLERIGDAMRPLPGLFLSGASYRGISINAACEAAPKAAQAILDFLGQGANGASPIF
ncbi:MAG: Protoporphyrinogen oxidase [candidate division BRC1 bacterium ADurb.BinA364]|nr:MAG: Protoporphyrinogen oxidase [candidate division BRC1 bacterium ADurb.BinA364]